MFFASRRFDIRSLPQRLVYVPPWSRELSPLPVFREMGLSNLNDYRREIETLVPGNLEARIKQAEPSQRFRGLFCNSFAGGDIFGHQHTGADRREQPDCGDGDESNDGRR